VATQPSAAQVDAIEVYVEQPDVEADLPGDLANRARFFYDRIHGLDLDKAKKNTPYLEGIASRRNLRISSDSLGR